MYKEKSKDGTIRLLGQPVEAWPVGSVYISIADVDPGFLFGGDWSRFANGRVLMGVKESDSDFDTVEETGGKKNHTLDKLELPEHAHSIPGHDHGIPASDGVGNLPRAVRGNATELGDIPTDLEGSTSTGDGPGINTPISILPPYINVYIWKRVA